MPQRWLRQSRATAAEVAPKKPAAAMPRQTTLQGFGRGIAGSVCSRIRQNFGRNLLAARLLTKSATASLH